MGRDARPAGFSASAEGIAFARVIAVDSAAGAMERIVETRPDVLVTDIGLPDEDGYSLIRRVRVLEDERGGNGIPAIALTGYTAPTERMRALQEGFQVHLSKPVEPEAIVDAIVRLLPNRMG